MPGTRRMRMPPMIPLTIDDHKLGLTLAALMKSVHRLVVIRIKINAQSKVFIEFRHECMTSCHFRLQLRRRSGGAWPAGFGRHWLRMKMFELLAFANQP